MQELYALTDKMMIGDFVSYHKLYHLFAFKVNLQGQPEQDTRWQPHIIYQLQSNAHDGNGYCLAFLSNLYLYGWGGLKINQNKAADFAKRSASLMNSYGEYQLGFLYLHGCGVVQNEDRAHEWFMRASIDENPFAYNMLGYMLENALAQQKKNLPEAIKYYRKGASAGLSFSEYNLGRAFAEGIGVGQNYEEALKWQQQACATGNAIAQNELGLWYEKGVVLPHDLPKAVQYFTLSARTYEPARYNLERLRKQGLIAA